MLHLRVISPADRTDGVVELLGAEPGVTHLTLQRGAALEPAGDVVEADLARECTDHVLSELSRRGIDRDGGMTLDAIDTTLSMAANRASAAAPGEASDAVIWEELIARTGEESKLNATFLAFLTLACLIATVGVVTNSPVTVVGAMVVGPEFGPLAGIAVNLVRRRYDLARRSSAAIVLGFPAAMLATAAGALLAEAAGLITIDTLAQADQVDFIYQVGPFSLVVAVLAGAAGMLSLVSAKSAALVGVFISVTTVPAAGYAVVAATLGQWELALESSAQLVVNLVGIVASAVAVLLLRRRSRARAGIGAPAPRA